MVNRKIKSLTGAIVAVFLAYAACSGSALADDPLRRGDSGEEVGDLQELLRDNNCFDYDEITGYFGAATEEGVRKFQAMKGLAVDGVAGDETMAMLRGEKTVAGGLKPDSVAQGMTGEKVEKIQKRLKELGLYTDAEITGYFGPITETAVRSFQEAAGIEPDGIVGTKTAEILFSSFSADSMIPGMKGQKVEKLQKRLKDLGYFTGPVTGLYGQMTEKSVITFQKLNGLQSDGVAGKKTCAAIYSGDARTEKEARRNPITLGGAEGQSSGGHRKAEDLVDYAMEFIGCPYVRGAEGPNAFECSGLTYYVYKHFGVTLPRKAFGQGYTEYGVKITDRKKLLPGDLVFFNSVRSDSDLCDHVGIYIGDGNFVHAPAPGMKVKISNLTNAKDFSWGRRVFE